MVILNVYKQQRTGKELCKAHYFKNGVYQRSSDVTPISLADSLTKGHSGVFSTNVATKTDLDLKSI